MLAFVFRNASVGDLFVVGERETQLSVQKYFSSAATALPVLTLISLTVAISYNVVFLFFAGALDIAPMTIADIFSKSWVIIPIAIFFLAIQITAIYSGFIFAKKYNINNSNNNRNNVGKSFRVLKLVFFALGSALILIAPVSAILARSIISDDLIVYKTIVVALVLINAGAGYIIVFGSVINNINVFAAILIYLLLMMIFGGAAIGGISSVTKNELSIVRYGDRHVFCGRLISIMERGVIIMDPTHNVKKLIPSPAIKSIETRVHCTVSSNIQK